MDKFFTHDSELQNSVIAKALQSEKMPSPSTASLEFIKNFARNFKVLKCGNDIVQDFVLN